MKRKTDTWIELGFGYISPAGLKEFDKAIKEIWKKEGIKTLRNDNRES